MNSESRNTPEETPEIPGLSRTNPPFETKKGGKEKKKESFNPLQELFDWGESLVVALLIIVLLFAFVFRLVGVVGNSMLPTLHEKDYLIVSDLGYTPSYGDIVVITKKGFLYNEAAGHEESFVKRVIATEGQTVDIDFNRGVVIVDGVELDEPYTLEPTFERGTLLFPCTVPEGHIFVLGDNRNGSTDSRWVEVGMVDERYVLGRVLFRIFPLSKIGFVK